MIGHYILQAVFVLLGSFIIIACLCNWDWFFLSQNAKMIVGTVGRDKARWYYALLGFLLVAAGIFFFLALQTK